MEDVAREVGVSKHTLYGWKAKYGGLEVNEAQRLRHQSQMSAIGQHRRTAAAFASLHGIRIGGGAARIIAALLAVEVHGRVGATLCTRWCWCWLAIVLATKTLLSRPSFQQGSVHREVFIGR